VNGISRPHLRALAALDKEALDGSFIGRAFSIGAARRIPVRRKSSPPKKILIVLLGAIGDVARGLSLASRIKSHWPEAHLAWAVEPPSADLVRNHHSIDAVHLFNRPEGKTAFREFRRALRRERFDLVLDLQRHLKSGLTTRATGARRRIGFHRRNSKELNWLFQTERIPYQENFSPKLEQYHAFGDYLDIPRPDRYDFGLVVPEDETKRVESIVDEAIREAGIEPPSPQQRAAFIIGANWESKRWSAKQFAELAGLVNQRWGLVPFLLGGTPELGIARDILALCPHVPLGNLVGRMTIIQLYAFARTVKVAVGGDTGASFLASIAGAPVISLFGATDPGRSAPFLSESLVLQSPIGCSPCYRRSCPGLNTLCMLDIPAEAVVHRVDSVMATAWQRRQ
jgi:ADP-heptose:LPS heptosyltransferase